ncbi:class I SAM-dependent methyltransferase [Aliarcobacter skirrowii]|uniref:class I SAM-dependent methyltransferase n=1 Tax=Aliarcobacter skirrowii TaxID=28200 RepID=UPI0029A42859|nr:class I SAM-dependent methyltransferase [Aliarcobacter skirrowii]MDX4063843.1 class I SAM-dependent methyltransferase [Aliarcobacter skirrowii]
MNIDKIRPVNIHNNILLQREKCGVDFYLKNSESFVEIDCPCCLKDSGDIVFYKYGYTHKKCKECDTLYVSPRPTQEMLFEYYFSYESPNSWNELLISTNNERKYLQHIPRVEKLETIINNSDNNKKVFVDLGAGNGNFAKAVQEANIFEEVIASDIADGCIEACKKQGLKTKKCTVTDFEEASIDCITFNDLIEHVFNPFEFLSDCYSRLKENGILMLSTPNGEGFDFKILKDKTENIVPPEHIQYLNPKSMEIILKKIGFEVLDISTPGILDVEIIKRQIKEKNLDLSNNDFLSFIYNLEDDSVEKNFQEFLQKSKLSSHMLVFARKN